MKRHSPKRARESPPSLSHKKLKKNSIQQSFPKKELEMKKFGPTAIAGGIAAYLGYKYLDDKLLLSNVSFLLSLRFFATTHEKNTGSRVFLERTETSENGKSCRQCRRYLVQYIEFKS